MTKGAILDVLGHFSDAPTGVQSIRGLVLQLAVQGRLVPQDPADEPAAALLMRIRVEKSMLGIASRTRKTLRPQSSDRAASTGIPAGWSLTTLDEAGLVNPRNVAADDMDAAFIPMALMSERYGEAPQFETRTWGEIRKGYTHLAEGDVGMAKITPCFENGKSGVFRGLPNHIGAGTTELHIFRPIGATVLSEYVCIFLKSPLFLAAGESVMRGVAGQQRVPTEFFAQYPFPLPPLAEQNRIITRLSELMKLCDDFARLQARRRERHPVLVAACLQTFVTAPQKESAPAVRRVTDNFDLLLDTPESVSELRKTILQLAARGRLAPQDSNDEPASELLRRIKAEKDELPRARRVKNSKSLPPIAADALPYAVPTGWTWAHFLDVANIASNLVAPAEFLDLPHIAPDSIEKNTGRLLDYGTVGEDGVRSGNHLFFPGQIIYSKIRPNLNKLTVVDFRGLCSADMYPIDSYLHTSFLAWFMLSTEFLRQSVRHDTRVAMPKINQDQLGRILVPVPPLPEQKRIAAKVDELMKLCDALSTRLAKSRDDADTLISAFVYHLSNPKAQMSEEV